MVNGQTQTVLQHLHRILAVPAHDDPPDRLLLKRFARTRDEAAFAALVRRHAALVWGVCWRMLRQTQDAEDCFQATFVVLARRAGTVCWHESVANWLYGVAARVAGEARARRLRQARQRQQVVTHRERAMSNGATHELCSVLDEEMSKLPKNCRAPLLLCYLEGRTTDQAARQLGWSQRTLERRLADGRERLRARLTRRGFTLSGVLLGVVLSEQTARATAPAGLVAATIKSAGSLGVSASELVLALAGAVSSGIGLGKLKLVGAIVLLLGTTIGVGVLSGSGAPGQGGSEPSPLVAEAAAQGVQPRQAGQSDNTKSQPAAAPDDLARRAWAILDIIEKNHPQPPPRQEAILHGVQAMLKAANAAPPEDLARRVAQIGSEEQFRALLEELRPKSGVKVDSAMIDGICEKVPGKPNLLTPTSLKIQDQLRANRYVGTGIQLDKHEQEQLPRIVIPFPRGPAHRAGALPGDLILEADGKSTKGMLDLEKVAEILRGPEGTSVTMVVRQPGATQTRTLKVTRGVIPIDSVFGFKRAGGERWDYTVDAEARIAYVNVQGIKVSTLHELRQVEGRLQTEGMRAAVLDFRFSYGGGRLHDAGLVAAALLDGELMWTARERNHAPNASHADRDPLFRGWPLALLINDVGDNAMGAVLAALQDNRRAILVGEPNKADGTIRRIFQLPGDGGSITVPTGQLERPDKERGWPVLPDRVIELSKDQRAAVQKWLTAKQLPASPAGRDELAPEDPQLAAAVAMLRDALSNAR
jgi:C-terminal peptidase prc